MGIAGCFSQNIYFCEKRELPKGYGDMPPDTICKTVHQYNKIPIPEPDMRKLAEIAGDYGEVKNYVYQRYGGIKSLAKIYPGYTVQNEMTESGLRAQLGLPSVYFYLAVFDALGDIKNQWTQAKARVSKSINGNGNLTAEDKHYLRFVMKQSQCLESILLGKDMRLSRDWEKLYQEVSRDVDTRRLNRCLCRMVRRHLRKLHTDAAAGFSISERAYRYGDHGIYISTKEKRKRIFILLTDNNQYKKQLYISLFPEEGNIRINVPVESKVKRREGYEKEVGLAFGLIHMFVTDEGHGYGKKYGDYQFALAEYVRDGNARYRKNKRSNPGRKKYHAGKNRLEAMLHTYINTEINRLLKTEKPKVIYIPKLPQSSRAGINKTFNHSVSMWQKGYVRDRLRQKCEEQSITLVEVLGKDISNQCSVCGSMGKKIKGVFSCRGCGAELPERENTARNVLKRGMSRSVG